MKCTSTSLVHDDKIIKCSKSKYSSKKRSVKRSTKRSVRSSKKKSVKRSVKHSSVKRTSKKRSVKRSSKKRSVKRSAKRSSKKRSVKRSSKKRSVKRSVKRSSKKRSVKRSSKKRSVKRNGDMTPAEFLEREVKDYLMRIHESLVDRKVMKFASPIPRDPSKMKEWIRDITGTLESTTHGYGIDDMNFMRNVVKRRIKENKMWKSFITRIIKSSKYKTAPYVLKNLRKHKIL